MTESTMHSIESEQLILSAALDVRRKPLLGSLLGLLSGSDFHAEIHGLAWNCIRTLHDTSSAHDAAALNDYTRRRGLFIGGVEYLVTLVEDPLAAAAEDESILAAATRVKNFSTLRNFDELLTLSKQMCADGSHSLEHVLSFVEDGVQSLRKTSQTSRTGPESMGEVMDKVMQGLEQQMDGVVKPATTTGYQALDAIAHGFVDEDLVVIGARPSMGKTALAVNIAENISDAGEQVLMFSMEMKSTALGNRALARKARVELSSIFRAELRDSDWSRVLEGMEQLGKSKVWIDDAPGLTIHDIRARARAFFAKHGKARIIVDYLQYVSPSGRGETRDHVSEVSRGLKNIARELKTTVIALSQLSRSLEARTNKRPLMSDLRESGAIEQDADVIMFLYRDEVYNPETRDPGIAEVIVAKHRNGPTGVARLGYSAATSSFFDLSQP